MLKPNAVGDSVGESDRPTWGLSLGPGDGEIILLCLDNHRVKGERERLEAQSCRYILRSCAFLTRVYAVDASKWRSWLFIIIEVYFVEKMNTCGHLIVVLL